VSSDLEPVTAGSGDAPERPGPLEVSGRPAEPVGATETILPATARRARVLETVRRLQFASVADLSVAFGVSEVTIRSDLDALAEEGHVQRVRGGAVHRTADNLEASYEQSQDTRLDQKLRIGFAAATLVASGQTVILDSGTTAAAAARAIAARRDLHDVTVFTNGVRTALELEPAIPNLMVLLTGGTLRRQQHSLVNPFGTIILDQVHAHVAILEAQGVDPSAGVTHINVGEAEIKRLMMRASRFRVLVADGSKIGQVSLVHLYGTDELDLLITDSTADGSVVAALREGGLDVRIAD